MIKNYKDKELIEKKHKLLNNIFINYLTIERNDSLFMICSLEPKEKIDKIYEVVDFELTKKINTKSNNLISANNKGLPNPANNGIFSQSFFIWDQLMLQRGKVEFEKKWGKILFEDNWRRSSKSALFYEEKEENSLSNSSIDLLMNSLPCENKDLLETMNDSILISLFNLGLIHHYETKDLNRAIKYFKRIVENFQPEKESIASLYELYNIYTSQNDNKLSNEIKKRTG